ncbi:hypothetical protein JHK85_052729 [Glycine max]|nr:hypothetical protein JHK85_052729 [Glycine max]
MTLFCRSWLIDIRGFAKKVKDTTLSTDDQMKDCGTYSECPKCHYHIDNSNVSHEWPGFPVGVKFDPSDVELLEHLAAKCCIGNREPHMFIHQFIPTLEGEQGICYTHPQNLPGAKTDGSSVHFFHKTANAYATGRRKRRKIHHQDGLTEEHVRWHKTGRTKAVTEDGVHKGFKKIMVLYIRSKKGTKPYKTNWVMHQYHLGSEVEKDGEYVVSKIFYQQHKQNEKNEENTMVEDSNVAAQAGPRTPKPNPPTRPCTAKCDDNFDENELLPFIQDARPIPGESHAPPSNVQDEDPAWLAGESQADCDFDGLEDILLCKEILQSSALLNHSGLTSTFNGDAKANKLVAPGNNNDYGSYGVSVLDTLELDTPPDFDLSNLQFGSQDSTLQWIDTP